MLFITIAILVSFTISTYLAFKLDKLNSTMKDLNIKNQALKDYVEFLETRDAKK